MSKTDLDLTPWFDYLDQRFTERSVALRLSVLAVLSRNHVLLLGPPGTAKSMLAREVANMVNGNLFQTLLTRFSTPEDVFGPLSLPALEAGAYERLTQGYIPEADVAFVDEIYKANASILNALLGVLNERTFANGNEVKTVPLRTMIAASNELPDDEEGLDALDDRLLLRIEVTPIQSPENFVAMLRADNDPPAAPTALAAKAIEKLDAQVGEVVFPEAAALKLLEIRRAAENAGLAVSDRRYKQSVQIMKTMAALDGRTEIIWSDFGVLRFILWRRPQEQTVVTRVVGAVLDELGSSNANQPTLNEMLDFVEDIQDQADAILARPQDYFATDTQSRMKELAHKTLKVSQQAENWSRNKADLIQSIEGIWSLFWQSSAGGQMLNDYVQALLEHDLFIRVLPNIDHRQAQEFKTERSRLLAQLATVEHGTIP